MTKPITAPAAQAVESAEMTPVVGIGASAGGLDPISEFLGSLPPTSGYAYVVVQHLDPTRKGLLAELLQRVTVLPVCEVAHGMLIQADHIYVIPPN
ncbi:MAG: chemotaxis protein CheB, partial [Pseudomonadota bacterium]